MIRLFLKFFVLSLLILLADSMVLALDVVRFDTVMIITLGALFVLPALVSRWIAPRNPGLRLLVIVLGCGCTFSTFSLSNGYVGRIDDGAPQLLRDAPLTAAYRAQGWRIANELAWDAPATARRGKRFGTYWVAPVVPPSWKRSDPIVAWVAATTYLSGRNGRMPHSAWEQPGELVRVVQFTPHWFLARRAAEERGLNIPADIALFIWRHDAAEAMHEQRLLILKLFAALNGIWLLGLLVARWRKTLG
jgi:hypothetical protein